jgi:hypothetical protein
MRLAFYIGVHHKPAQFDWLYSAIQNDADHFCLHIDRKAPAGVAEAVRRRVGTRHNVDVLPRRWVNWAGWSQVAVELDAIRHLLQRDGWRYYINVSGQDYPIQPLDAVRRTLENAWPQNFIEILPLARVTDPCDPHLHRRLCLEVGPRLVSTRLPVAFPSSIDTNFKGSSWHMLSRDFCEWMVNSALLARIAARASLTKFADELFFQAMVMNGPFRDLPRRGYAREIIWPGPKVLRMADYERLTTSAALFARKFDESQDVEILARLAARNGHPVPAGARPAHGATSTIG